MAKYGIDKDIVLQAAIEIADERGLSNVTLKDLAAKLKIKAPSLYSHVNGLPGLNQMLSVYGLSCLKEKISNAAVGLAGNEALLAMGRAYMDFAQQHPGLYEATACINIWEDEEAAQVAHDIIALLRKVLAVYSLGEEDVVHIIRISRSLLHGFAFLVGRNGFGNPLSVESSFEKAIQIMLAGMEVCLTK